MPRRMKKNYYWVNKNFRNLINAANSTGSSCGVSNVHSSSQLTEDEGEVQPSTSHECQLVQEECSIELPDTSFDFDGSLPDADNEGNAQASFIDEWQAAQEESCNELSDISYDSEESLAYADNIPDSEDELPAPKTFKQKLILWAIQHNITHSALTKLLKIYCEEHPNSGLPLDSRTLMQTQRKLPTEDFDDGASFVYLGLKNTLCRVLEGVEHSVQTLGLVINIDGTPVYKSTSKSFYPILGMIKGISKSPFFVGVYSGSKKPQIDQYLKKFVDEVITLTSDGLYVGGTQYALKIEYYVCDAIARQHLKKIKNHVSAKGCERCTVKGVHRNKTMSFDNINAPLRSDDSFAQMTDRKHHSDDGEHSPLLRTGIGMVSQFPLDYLHLVLLGVMRRLLNMWLEIIPYKLSSFRRNSFEKLYRSFKGSIPLEFSRKPRSLNEAKNFKGTELRLLLLYIGPLILDRVLSPSRFKHFLLLAVAIRILSSKENIEIFSIGYANKLLRKFVETYNVAYPGASIVYNVHSLIHLADDVRKFGELDNFSSFPFENLLSTLKSKVRSGNRPLVQFCKRLAECVDNDAPLNSNKVNRFTIKPRYMKESCVRLKNGKYGIVTGIEYSRIKVKLFSHARNIFESPCESTEVGFFAFEELSAVEIHALYSDILYKCIYIKKRDTHFVAQYLTKFG